jgi:hypothetical protein
MSLPRALLPRHLAAIEADFQGVNVSTVAIPSATASIDLSTPPIVYAQTFINVQAIARFPSPIPTHKLTTRCHPFAPPSSSSPSSSASSLAAAGPASNPSRSRAHGPTWPLRPLGPGTAGASPSAASRAETITVSTRDSTLPPRLHLRRTPSRTSGEQGPVPVLVWHLAWSDQGASRTA